MGNLVTKIRLTTMLASNSVGPEEVLLPALTRSFPNARKNIQTEFSSLFLKTRVTPGIWKCLWRKWVNPARKLGSIKRMVQTKASHKMTGAASTRDLNQPCKKLAATKNTRR